MATQAVVQGAGFLAAEGLIGAAELALDGVCGVKSAVLDAAPSILDEVNDVQRGRAEDLSTGLGYHRRLERSCMSLTSLR